MYKEDDKDIVLEAVKNKGLIIKYVSKRLRNDKDVAIAALKQSTGYAMYLEPEVKQDPEVDAILNPKTEE